MPESGFWVWRHSGCRQNPGGGRTAIEKARRPYVPSLCCAICGMCNRLRSAEWRGQNNVKSWQRKRIMLSQELSTEHNSCSQEPIYHSLQYTKIRAWTCHVQAVEAVHKPLDCRRKVRGWLPGNSVIIGFGWSRMTQNDRRMCSEKSGGSCSGDVDQFCNRSALQATELHFLAPLTVATRITV